MNVSDTVNISSVTMADIPSEYLPFHNAELVIGSLSLMANSILLYFICFKTPRELEGYQPFLLVITVADIFFDVYVIFLLRPVMIFPVFAAIITGPLKAVGEKWIFYLGVFAAFLWMYCMVSINLAFLYRYVCIAHKRLHELIVKRKTQVILNLTMLGLCLAVFIYPATQEQDHGVMISLVEKYIPSLRGHVDEFLIVAVKLNDSLMLINAVIIFIPSCLLNALFAVLIIRKLRTFRASFSASTYKMHLRLAACLLCQTFCPMLLMALPIMLIIYFRVVRAPSEYFRIVSSAIIITVACHPLVNALCTLFFVQPYRRQLTNGRWIRLLKTKFGKTGFNTVDLTIAPATSSLQNNERPRRQTWISERKKSIIVVNPMVNLIEMEMAMPRRHQSF